MAVYKPTYCYPYLNAVDIRPVSTSLEMSGETRFYPYVPKNEPLAKFLSCKIDTSNSNITGYSIRLLDDENKQIFPVDGEETSISPITELQEDNVRKALGIDSFGDQINSGINGTQLQIPFFQSDEKKVVPSKNAIYYRPRFAAEHVIMTKKNKARVLGLPGDTEEDLEKIEMTDFETPYNWKGVVVDGGRSVLHYTKWGNTSVEAKNVVMLDNEVLIMGELVLVGAWVIEQGGHDVIQSVPALFEVSKAILNGEEELVLEHRITLNNTAGYNDMVVILKGDLFHNCCFSYVNSSRYGYSLSPTPFSESLWVDINKNPITNIQLDNQILKWEITLYQGNMTEILKSPELREYHTSIDSGGHTVANDDSYLNITDSSLQATNYDLFLADVAKGFEIDTCYPKGTVVYYSGIFYKSKENIYCTNWDITEWEEIDIYNYIKKISYTFIGNVNISGNPNGVTTVNFKQLWSNSRLPGTVGHFYNLRVIAKALNQIDSGPSEMFYRYHSGTPIIMDKQYFIGAAGMGVDYRNINENYLDIKLNTGTILGSTPQRIQIASDDPYILLKESSNFDDVDLSQVILPTTTSGDIVLQGTYAAIGQGVNVNGFIVKPPNQILTNQRFYVKSYDANYGHIYPEENEMITNSLDSATHCQFFKCSNNPDELLAQDIVKWGINQNIPLVIIEEGTSSAAIAIDVSVEDIPFNSEDEVLLTNQDISYQNGLFTYYFSTTGQEVDGVTYHHFLRRTTYNTWGAYLGKIFYCQQGDLARQNIECLAIAGSYVLWDPTKNTEGSSLLFTPEIPLLLFPQKILASRTYQVFYNGTPNTDSSGYYIDCSNGLIDKQNVSTGDRILCKASTNNAGIVTQIQDNKIYYSLDNNLKPEEGDYLYFITGQEFGKRVYKWTGDNIEISWDLHSAWILRNHPELTYISPYINIQKGMALKLLNSKRVAFLKTDNDNIVQTATYTNIQPTNSVSNVIYTPWIKIKGYNSVLNFITHIELVCDSSGGIDTITEHLSRLDGSYGLASYGMIDNVPWKYEIRSYFMTSNENIFYPSESSYIRLKRNGIPYTGLKMYSEQEFFTNDEISGLPLYENEDKIFCCSYFEDQTLITTRSLSLSAEYKQFSQKAWESYRWVLLDNNGNILQDTGEQYEGDIEVTFSGLTQTSSRKQYYIILYINDNVNNSFACIIKITAVQQDYSPANIYDFTATLDKETHSVLLNLLEDNIFLLDKDNKNLLDHEDNDLAVEDENEQSSYSYYRREYNVYQKPGTKINCYFSFITDNTARIYNDSAKTEEISPIQGYFYIDNETHFAYKYTQGYFKIEDPFYKEFIGEWEPVLLKTTEKTIRDFNIKSGHSYQYICYIDFIDNNDQIFANFKGKVFYSLPNGQGYYDFGNIGSSINKGEPVKVCWDEWSLIELIPEQVPVNSPIVKKSYKANLEQNWLLKFSLETGGQVQNFTHTDIQTLGQYLKIGMGKLDYISGEVTALLGSEIIPYSKERYIERLPSSRVLPLSTNEKVKMLKQWRNLMSSKNPKLLTDIKGQSWIVQTFSSSNKPQNFVLNQPDTITFQWKQIEDLAKVIIHGEGGILEFEKYSGENNWKSIF